MAASFPKSIKILLAIVLCYLILVYGKPLLAPIVFAGLFSMLFLPLGRRLEAWGVNKALAVFISLLLFIAFFFFIGMILTAPISDLRRNSGVIEQNINLRVNEVKDFIASKIGISLTDQEEIIRQQQKTTGHRLSSFIAGSIGYMGTALTDMVLVLVYMFLFMYFRQHLQKFVLRLVPEHEQQNARDIMSSSRKLAHKYLTGLALMIVSLWVMYSIGFSIVGVKNAVFFAIVCGLLEIVPFVGNVVGTALTVLFSVAQGASSNQILGILFTYGLVQFFQTYFLEPLVVGKEVSIHPLFTILGIVTGEFIWGIPGMVLALPVLGVAKIICDHTESLKPYGFLIGGEKRPLEESGLVKKFRNVFKRQ